MTGSTVRSNMSKGISSVLLRDTPIDEDVLNRRDPIDKFLSRNKEHLRSTLKKGLSSK